MCSHGRREPVSFVAMLCAGVGGRGLAFGVVLVLVLILHGAFNSDYSTEKINTACRGKKTWE